MMERMIAELQNRLNSIRECREDGLDELEKDMMIDFLVCKRFCEAVTGKVLEVRNWKVQEVAR